MVASRSLWAVGCGAVLGGLAFKEVQIGWQSWCQSGLGSRLRCCARGTCTQGGANRVVMVASRWFWVEIENRKTRRRLARERKR